MKIATALIALLLTVFPVMATDFTEELAKAKAGDYTAQRNVAHRLTNGDGTEQNVIEGCAWRLLIVTTQGPRVVDTDGTLLECLNRVDPRVVEARSKLLTSGMRLRVRSVSEDIAVFTEGRCPGPRCSPPDERFAIAYRQALSGELAQMRWLIQCFSSQCDGVAPFSSLRACAWSTVLLLHAGPSALAEDRQTERRSCFALTPLEAAVVRNEQAAIRDLMLERANSRRR